ncbi:FAD-dependent oxidoreductase [Dactylosporangium sp. CS-047395]|uniref:FAD-dependent oxidoreductase n=1 Tax=Dactylosporangium sp. CS-047395 TaxID=3239936 RepID=UPI003D91C8E4
MSTAVVIGASMGGLLAARALHEHFERVVIVERDRLPDSPSSRRCVPQGRQLHVLLARGREILEELFPGLTAELAGEGAPIVDLHGEVHWYNDGFLMRRAPSDLLAVGVSRPLLEHTVRGRVAALPGVSLVAESDVTALVTDAARTTVTGVVVTPLDGAGPAYRIAAGLVVDAGGRASRSPHWLRELGYAAAPEDVVRVDLTYVTRLYEHVPEHLDGMSGVLANAVPGNPRAAIAAAVEGGRVAVALNGMLGLQPPTDDAGMAEFADALPAPHFARIIRSARPVGPPFLMRYPGSVRRRYERLRRFPAGFLVFGDALCSFNPIYGQGMTVAALEARLLASNPRMPARRFFRAAARIVDGPWSIAVGTDLRFAEVSGPRSARVRFVNWFVHRLHAAATRDETLGAAFIRVLNLVRPPTSLLAPTIVRRVLGARPLRTESVPAESASAARTAGGR